MHDIYLKNPHKYLTLLTFLSILSLFSTFEMRAQVYGAPASTHVNQQLRAMFASISPPSPQPPIFYDQSAHFIDKDWWTPLPSDTSTASVWSVLYDEMWCSHYDTTQFLRVDTVFARADRFMGDTVLLGIIYYPFCTLKDSSLYDTTYFTVDTTGPTLLDHPNATASPYEIDTVFNICAFREMNSSGTLTFRVDPDFIFNGTGLQLNADYGRVLQVNFDDAAGWHTVPDNAVTHHEVTYNTGGEHVISARVITESNNVTEAGSSARIVAPEAEQFTQPDDTWTHIPGITVGVFGGCSNEDGLPEQKFIIVMEGYDFEENTTIRNTYNSYVRRTGLDLLRNYGYTFLVIDWADSKRPMQQNAMSIVTLVDDLKCTLAQVGDDPQHQFVMMGASMGGVVGRYALTWMEANPNFSACFPDNHHNTRLLITMDSPHQGAYVPLAFQQLYKTAKFALTGVLPYSIQQQYIRAYDILNRPASRQLLNLHIESSTFPNANFSAAPERTAFLDDLVALNPQTGGYPEHVKLMAISNGLMTGEQQVGINDGCVMSPGDRFVQGEAQLNMTILGFPVVGRFADIDLQALNPGSQFFHLGHGSNTWTVRLKWVWETVCAPPFGWPCVSFPRPNGFTVGFVNVTNVSLNRTSATGIPSWGLMPGGRRSFDGSLEDFQSRNIGLTWIDPTALSLEWNTTMPATNCPLEQVHSSSFGTLRLGLDLDIYSQGLNFCFVPLQSALDYNGGVPQDWDIYNDPINVKMAATPFDVIVGEVNGLPGYPQARQTSTLTLNPFRFPAYNLTHVTLQNHQLRDSLMQNWMILNGAATPHPDTNRWAFALYLNREIGDEEMLLDNLELDRPAIFQAEYDIIAGDQTNRPYAYLGQAVQPDFVFRNYSFDGFAPDPNPFGYNLTDNGIFARDDAFTILPAGNAVLRADLTINTAGSVVMGGLVLEFLPQWVCDSNIYKTGDESARIDLKKETTKMTLFPNPVSPGDALFLRGLPEERIHLQLMGVDGQMIAEQTLHPAESQDLRLSIESALPAGVYFLGLNSATMRKNFKFVVQ